MHQLQVDCSPLGLMRRRWKGMFACQSVDANLLSLMYESFEPFARSLYDWAIASMPMHAFRPRHEPSAATRSRGHRRSG